MMIGVARPGSARCRDVVLLALLSVIFDQIFDEQRGLELRHGLQRVEGLNIALAHLRDLLFHLRVEVEVVHHHVEHDEHHHHDHQGDSGSSRSSRIGLEDVSAHDS